MTRMAEQRARSGGIPASALASPPAALPESKMAAARRGVARGEEAMLPVFGRVWIEVLGMSAGESIEAATFEHMESIGLKATVLHEGSYNLHRFARVLAEAVRVIDDPTHQERFGSVEEWCDEHEAIIGLCIERYLEIKRRLDPSSTIAPSETERAAIEDAFKKKDSSLLRSFGAPTLTSWLLSGAVQLSS